ncbi:glutaredoxin 2 [Thalassolituus sp. LLYu03]|uniref:glutaredoxin 2 n=1 Tax=Thalassolituus sp. LLYu03 TaxID=3421656 RepID=UPI003D2E4417
MRLYIYHHCPFCLRAVMVANYKNVEHETVFLLNDDEDTCYRLVNAKQVPILELADGSAMAESLDIAHKLDELGDAQKIMRAGNGADAFVQAFFRTAADVYALLYPRCLALGLPEFMSDDATHYFRVKKEIALGKDFAQAMQDTPRHIAAVQAMLNALPSPELPADHGNTLSWDDLLIFPTLRNLTMVDGLQFPPAIAAYMNAISLLTDTQLYTDQAL